MLAFGRVGYFVMLIGLLMSCVGCLSGSASLSFYLHFRWIITIFYLYFYLFFAITVYTVLL